MSFVSPISQARSFLFVPGDRAERFSKALGSGADVVIIDLEDAVLPSARQQAREDIRSTWRGLSLTDRARLMLRINAAGTEWHAPDVDLATDLGAQGLGGVMLAKAENGEVLNSLAARIESVPLVPLVESGAGLDALPALASIRGVIRLALGHLDLQSDLGLACGPGEEEIAPARWEIVRATRRAQLPPPIDGVTTDFKDLSKVHSDCERALRMGFGAKLCIHPAQVGAIHEAFAPRPEQIEHARRVLAAAERSHGKACVLDGRMVDAPVIALARRTLERLR